MVQQVVEGKCPHCGAGVADVKAEEVRGHHGNTVVRLVSYRCEKCNKVLSIVPDPLVLVARIEGIVVDTQTLLKKEITQRCTQLSAKIDAGGNRR